jgi:hypothetical protein
VPPKDTCLQHRVAHHAAACRGEGSGASMPAVSVPLEPYAESGSIPSTEHQRLDIPAGGCGEEQVDAHDIGEDEYRETDGLLQSRRGEGQRMVSSWAWRRTWAFLTRSSGSGTVCAHERVWGERCSRRMERLVGRVQVVVEPVMRVLRQVPWKDMCNPPFVSALVAIGVGCTPMLNGALVGTAAPLALLFSTLRSLSGQCQRCMHGL